MMWLVDWQTNGILKGLGAVHVVCMYLYQLKPQSFAVGSSEVQEFL